MTRVWQSHLPDRLTVDWPRFEHGSWFPYPDLTGEGIAELPEHARSHVASSVTGRGALVAVLSRLVAEKSRIWLPSYYCPTMKASVRQCYSNQLMSYRDSPRSSGPTLPTNAAMPGDVVIVQNLFGLRTEPDYAKWVHKDIFIVEDHTHDPWSRWAANSRSTYAFASLRKTLPLPDGAITWSRRSTNDVPVPHNRPELVAVLGRQLVAMQLKREYLNGSEHVARDSYRFNEAALRETLQRLPHGPMTPVSRDLLSLLPVLLWREHRRRNHDAMANLLRGEGLDVLAPDDSGCVPFGVVVDFHDAELVARVRAGLMTQRIWPSTLWPSATSDPVGAFADQHLVFHADHRYTEEMMRYVGHVVVGVVRR
jgi:hypothetical protein